MLYKIVTIALLGVVAYCISLFVIGFSISLWEAITKKEAPQDKQDKVIRIVALCLFIIFTIKLLQDWS